MSPIGPGERSGVGLNESIRPVEAEQFRTDPFAQVQLRFAMVVEIRLQLDDVEVQVVQRSTHRVKLVFRFHHQVDLFS